MAYLKFQCSFSAISLLLLTILGLSSANYDGKYKYNGSNPYSDEKPKPENDNILSTTIAIQGMVYCKEGHDQPFPLEGAVVRITCDAVDKVGFETTPYSFLSEATKGNGYFLATLCPSEISANRKLTKCKAFLELSPSDTCNDPMDVNNAVSGALLSSHHFLEEKKMKMYTVGPFFFTTEPQPVSNGY